jgi:hypothetical protein
MSARRQQRLSGALPSLKPVNHQAQNCPYAVAGIRPSRQSNAVRKVSVGFDAPE